MASLPGSRKPPGIGADDIRSAYELPKFGGKGRTVAIVNAFDYPTA
ncbi:hypothetical protein [Streptomyces sp. NPDC002889]